MDMQMGSCTTLPIYPACWRRWHNLAWAGAVAVCALAIVFRLFQAAPHSVRAAGPTYVPAGEITGTVVWTRSASPYVVQGEVSVAPSASLSLEAGVEVRFDAGAGLAVEGELNAIGTATQPITFTSNLTSPQPGDWQQLNFLSNARVRLAWCDIGYGGQFMTPAEVMINGSDVQVSQCRIHHSQSLGVYVTGDGAGASLQHVRIEDNGKHGLEIWQAAPSLLDVRLARNQGVAVRQDINACPVYRHLTASGNLTDAVEIEGGTIVGARSWDFGQVDIPVHVKGILLISDTLTLAPGSALRFAPEAALMVQGSLYAMGLPTAPITLSGQAATPGSWRGVSFSGDSRGRLAWCDLGYAGQVMYGAVLEISSSDVQISHCRIHHGLASGIAMFSDSASPTLSDLRLEHNAAHGLEAHHARMTATDLFIAGNGGAAVQQDMASQPVYRNLTATGNLTDALVIRGGPLETGVHWNFVQAGLPVQINGDISIPHGRFLSLEPGSALHFVTDTTLIVDGDLYALGEANAPITLTGVLAQPGAWAGVHLNVDSRAILNNCVVEYGGAGGVPALIVGSNGVTLQHCRVHHNAADGIHVAEAQPVIVANAIYSNARTYPDTYGLRGNYALTLPVDARHNWWGHASGPYHPDLNPAGLGEPITGGVSFAPWLTHTQGESPLLGQFVLDVAGPDVTAPGQTADYGMFYNNQSTRTITAPLVMALPYKAEFVESTGGGVYWPARHQVVWRIGDLTPGRQGTLSARVRYDWGAEEGLEDVTMGFPADVLGESLQPYLTYTPTLVVAKTVLSETHLTALRQISPELDALYMQAISQGMKLVVVEEFRLAQGTVFTQAVLLDFNQRAVMFLRHYGDRVLASRYDPTSYTIRDAAGGATFYPDQLRWVYWEEDSRLRSQSWLSPDANYVTCLATCLAPKIPMWVLTRRIKMLGLLFDAFDCVACAQYFLFDSGSWQDCVACGSALTNIPGVGEALDSYECSSGCMTDVLSRRCFKDLLTCLESGLYALQDCNILTGEYGTMTVGNCKKDQYCLYGVGCVPHGYVPDTLLTRIAIARDPNAKSGPPSHVLPGEQVTYTIFYENEGQGSAYGVFVVDRLSEHLDDTSLRLWPAGALTPTVAGRYITPTRTLIWNVGELAPKGQAGSSGALTFTIRLKPDLPGGTVIMNQATVHFPSVPEQTPTNQVVNVVQPVSAQPQTVRTQAGQAVSITLHGQDVSHAALTYTLASQPLNGRLYGIAPGLTYSPAFNFTGLDRFSFRVSNSVTESQPAEVSILVEPSASDTQPPTVTWTDPKRSAAGVWVATSPVMTDAFGPAYAPFIALQFSEAINPSSLTTQTFQLLGEGGQPVLATVAYDGTSHQARLLPRAPLSVRVMYTARLSADIRDAAGNRLGQAYTWTFYTSWHRVYLPLVLRVQPAFL